jgi:hypothetical protein
MDSTRPDERPCLGVAAVEKGGGNGRKRLALHTRLSEGVLLRARTGRSVLLRDRECESVVCVSA